MLDFRLFLRCAGIMFLHFPNSGWQSSRAMTRILKSHLQEFISSAHAAICHFTVKKGCKTKRSAN